MHKPIVHAVEDALGLFLSAGSMYRSWMIS